ncbi:peptidoglycan-binding protein [Flavobacterium sp.]|uniref:peptidoglycan-binding domain-containing protein n=1 Tax=Flavobacterium sp. TaxID=239 RepID=UPI003751C445
MTNEDKIYLGVGGTLLIAGAGFYFYKNAQANKDQVQQETIDTTFEDVTNTPVIKLPTKATPPFSNTVKTPIVPIVAQVEVDNLPTKGADTFKYSVGQEVMASFGSGTKTYDAIKMADGNWKSGRIPGPKFNVGDKIGKIIWVGKRPDGTYRYVVERIGRLLITRHWIADVRGIAPIGKKLPIKKVYNTKGLILTRILHKGIHNSEEVKELQKRLGVVADGDFGLNTEKALFSQKKVKQIRLADWK